MDLEDYCRQNNIVICWQYIKEKVHGLCFLNGIDQYIVLNSRYCNDDNRETLKHELVHVLENHLYDDVKSKREMECKVKIISKDYDTYFKVKGLEL